MNYQSTRDTSISVTSAQAVIKGLSRDGGLFVPKELPSLDFEFITSLLNKSYVERAKAVLSLFLTDFSEKQLSDCVEKAYSEEKFDSADADADDDDDDDDDEGEGDSPTPIAHLFDGRYILELWHGPTCAFKDMALQLLPRLMTASADILNIKNEIIILAATSGDTGKAALEGFKDVEGTRIIVFYPVDGVSPMQKRQMASQTGENVHVCAIKGNFDDAQTAVKSIFTDKELEKQLSEMGMQFSSANSINWGRLVPQIVYYASAYADLVSNGEIEMGDKINVCVPTGNFGNILAAYYAKKMGIPFDRLICASNENRVLTDFIKTGRYDKNREFHTTISPSMDILISSNLERLLFDLSGEDGNAVKGWLSDLNEKGFYEVSAAVKDKLVEGFFGGYCSDEQTKRTISEVFEKYSYLLDTHTAVAVSVYEEYRKSTGDEKKVLIASTANPYKFAGSVLSALTQPESEDEFERIEELSALSGLLAPSRLSELKNARVLFDHIIEKSDLAKEVLGFLKQ